MTTTGEGGGSSWKRNEAIEQFEWEVLEVERHRAAHREDPSLCRKYQEKRDKLQALNDHWA